MCWLCWQNEREPQTITKPISILLEHWRYSIQLSDMLRLVRPMRCRDRRIEPDQLWPFQTQLEWRRSCLARSYPLCRECDALAKDRSDVFHPTPDTMLESDSSHSRAYCFLNRQTARWNLNTVSSWTKKIKTCHPSCGTIFSIVGSYHTTFRCNKQIARCTARIWIKRFRQHPTNNIWHNRCCKKPFFTFQHNAYLIH